MCFSTYLHMTKSKSKGSGNTILESWYTILSHAINKFECVVLENFRTSDLYSRNEVIKLASVKFRTPLPWKDSCHESPRSSQTDSHQKPDRPNKNFQLSIKIIFIFILHIYSSSSATVILRLLFFYSRPLWHDEINGLKKSTQTRKKVDTGLLLSPFYDLHAMTSKLYIAKEKNGQKNINNNNNTSLDGFWLIDWLITW